MFTLLIFFTQILMANADSANTAVSHSNSSTVVTSPGTKIEETVCHSPIDPQDPVTNHSSMQAELQKTYNEGIPKKLREQLVAVRSQVDTLSGKFFSVNSHDSQTVETMIKATVRMLDQLIQLLPDMQSMAPDIRMKIVLPFTNINSLVADYIDCLNNVAIADTHKKDDLGGIKTMDNPFKDLSPELTELNTSLYDLETFESQYSRYRSDFATIDEDGNEVFKISNLQQIPAVLNAIQLDIEDIMPALELTKNYASLAGRLKY